MILSFSIISLSCGENNTIENNISADSMNSVAKIKSDTFSVDSPRVSKPVEKPSIQNGDRSNAGKGSGDGAPGGAGGSDGKPPISVMTALTPEQVAKKYLTFLAMHKYSEAKYYADEKAIKYLQLLEGSSDDFNRTSKLSFSTLETTINAEVSTLLKFEVTYNPATDMERKKIEIVKLYKYNDGWKVTR